MKEIIEKMFGHPISFRSRDHRVAELVRKRTTTDDELFAAQFLDWPVRGLEKDTPRPQEVRFRNFAGLFTIAYVRQDTPEREIHLNRLLLSPVGSLIGAVSSRQAWARLHDVIEGIDLFESRLLSPRIEITLLAIGALCFASSYRYAAASSLVKLFASSIADEVGQEHIHLMQTKDGDQSFARAAFQAAAKDAVNNSPPLTRAAIEAAQLIDVLLTWMPRDYFGADHEIQARLHNLMVRGYPAWGRLPQTKDELWAALYDMGVKAPAMDGFRGNFLANAIEQWLSFPGREALHQTFRKHSRLLIGHTAPPVAEINIGLNATRSNEVLKDYWLDCLPAAFGDLLIKYGDSRGRQKMGFSNEPDILGLPSPLRPADEAPPTPTGGLRT